MRLFFLFTLIVAFLPLTAYPQQNSLPETITLDIRDKTFEEILLQLHQQYQVNFYYSSSHIPLHTRISIICTNKPFIDAISEICSRASVDFQINGDQVILFKKPLTSNAGRISGYIQDSLTGERLIGAAIVIEGTTYGTVTNAYGYFSYALDLSKYIIRCSYVGYEPIIREIEVKENTILNFSMIPYVKAIEAVRLESGQLNRTVNLKAGTDIAPSSLMRSYAAMLSENDVLQFIKMMPGVQTTTEGLNGLFVRGGMPQHTSFIIDDAPMYNMFHFSGWFSTINPDAVKEVRLFKGHLPGKSSGSLASVIDIRLRDGNNQHFNASGSIGTITSRITLEGPVVKNKASFIFSARRTYMDQVIRLFRLEDVIDMGKIYFYDLNAKINYTLNRNNRFYFSSYAGKDLIDDNGGVRWGNSFLSTRWNHLFSENVFSNLCMTGSWYKHAFDTQTGEDEVSQLLIRIRNFNAKYDISWYTPKNNKLNFGINVRYNFLPPANITGTVLRSNLIAGDPHVYRQNLYGSYIQGTFHLFRELYADLGLKVNYAYRKYPPKVKNYLRPEPGLGLTYSFNPEISVKSAYSRNYQYHHGIGVFELLLPFDKYMMAGTQLKPQYADHITTGIFCSPENQQIELSVEAYYSIYHNQYRLPVTDNIFFERDIDFTPGHGTIKSFGGEVSLRKLSGRFTGMMSYTLSKTLRKESEINSGSYYFAYYDRRHDLVLSVNFKAGRRTDISSNWVYMSGNPYSLPVGKYELRGRSVPLYDQDHLYNRRMPDYHRLDLSVRYGLGKKMPFRHHLTLMLYNVYSRRNPVFYSYSDVADGDTGKNPNSDYHTRSFSMMGYYFFNFFPSVAYEFKFGK